MGRTDIIIISLKRHCIVQDRVFPRKIPVPLLQYFLLHMSVIVTKTQGTIVWDFEVCEGLWCPVFLRIKHHGVRKKCLSFGISPA